MEEEEALIRELIREESSRRIFAQVFDKQTIENLHGLASKGHFEQVEFVVSTGKEAHVFRAVDAGGNYKAVKIYKIETSDFGNMQEYIDGDVRFGKVKHTQRELVYAWAKKEFKNLEEFRKAGVRVPLPYACRNNVLVMEFIGSTGKAAKTMKEQPPANIKEFHELTAEFLARMVYKAKIVHADLSEYNILNSSEEYVVIDVGQGVPLTHPKAKEFFERDVKNMAAYLTGSGEKISSAELLEEVKAWKGKKGI